MEFYEEEHDFFDFPVVEGTAADELFELIMIELDDGSDCILLALLELHYFLYAFLVELLVNDCDVARLCDTGLYLF